MIPARERLCDGMRASGSPSNRMSPLAGTMPESAFMRLDLPAPFGPITVNISPLRTVRLTPRSA
jgi:hypothetical protein